MCAYVSVSTIECALSHLVFPVSHPCVCCQMHHASVPVYVSAHLSQYYQAKSLQHRRPLAGTPNDLTSSRHVFICCLTPPIPHTTLSHSQLTTKKMIHHRPISVAIFCVDELPPRCRHFFHLLHCPLINGASSRGPVETARSCC